MSLGIAFKGPEGIVLAADSRVTLMITAVQAPNQPSMPSMPPMLLPSTYDNATKMLRVKGQDHVGTVTYGVGALGAPTEPRTAHSYIPELEHKLKDVGRLGVKDFADKLSDFFLEKWNTLHLPVIPGQDMVFLVGGYDEGAPYGRVFDILIPSRPTPVEYYADAGQFGIVWGGQREHADRLIHGFDSRLPELVKNFLNLDDQKRDELCKHLKTLLQTPVPFAFLPLQDSVDLAIFLIRTTIVMQHWLLGLRGVGGAIDVAIITRTNGFKEIQKKEIKGEDL
jgi:hypothetical protein